MVFKRIHYSRSFILFMFLAYIMVVSCLTTAQASVSRPLTYNQSITNDFFDIPNIPGILSIDITVTKTITGTAVIKGPGGAVVATINVSGPDSQLATQDIVLPEAGTHTVSENFHMELSGSALGIEEKVTDDGTSEWAFENAVAGSTGTFKYSSNITMNVTGHSDNISVAWDNSTSIAHIENTEGIPKGAEISATMEGIWSVTTSISTETPDFGSIQVNTNLDEATFTVSGPAVYNGSGKSWSVAQAPVGNYTVTFHDVPGYKTPTGSTQNLGKGGTITFDGEYVLATGDIVVNANLADATFSITGPVNYNGSGQAWSVSNAPVGDYTIVFNDVTGFGTPAGSMLKLEADGTITFVGNYTTPTGIIVVNANLDTASFTITGPANYQGNGKSWSVNDAPIGDYTIVFNDVTSYRTPTGDTQKLTEDATITFNGNYILITGTIVVNTNLDEATFGITGTNNYQGGAKAWSVNGAPIGDYTIAFNEVDGYITPVGYALTLEEDGTITFEGIYIEKPKLGTIVVNANLDEAIFTVTGPVVYEGSGKSWSVNDAPIGDYTIVFHNIPGYETPAGETRALIEDGTITFNGNYILLIGTLVVNSNLDEAKFTITGPVDYQGNGKNWSVNAAPIGDYTITFDDILNPAYN